LAQQSLSLSVVAEKALNLRFRSSTRSQQILKYRENIMSINRTAITALFATAIVCAAPVQAQESQVERVLSTMVSQAMHNVTAEINEEVQKSILTSAYNFTFAKPVDPAAPATKVTITDLASVKTNAKDSDLNEKSED